MKIVFMGTSDFAVPTLKKLLSINDYKILAVYTKEPKISGRGNKLQISPIHDFANKKILKFLLQKHCENP
jgi:methionyl-tRNA formyltransferase